MSKHTPERYCAIEIGPYEAYVCHSCGKKKRKGQEIIICADKRCLCVECAIVEAGLVNADLLAALEDVESWLCGYIDEDPSVIPTIRATRAAIKKAKGE